MVSELEALRQRRRRALLWEVAFGLLGVASLLAMLFAPMLFGIALALALPLLGVSYFDWQRKRLERKIDAAEGVVAAKRAERDTHTR